MPKLIAKPRKHSRLTPKVRKAVDAVLFESQHDLSDGQAVKALAFIVAELKGTVAALTRENGHLRDDCADFRRRLRAFLE